MSSQTIKSLTYSCLEMDQPPLGTKNYKYCAIIVTYNRVPNLQVINKSILEGTLDLLIISDNSGNKSLLDGIRQQFIPEKSNKYIIIENNSNLGISKAMNIALNEASKLGYNFAFLLDDDANISDDFFKLEKEMIENFINDGNKIGAVCPAVSNNFNHLGKQVKRYYASEVKRCITSGMLLNVSVAKYIGGYPESFFLGMADVEFTYRMYLNGFKIIRINRVLICQEFGKSIKSPLASFLVLPIRMLNFLNFNLNRFNDIIYYCPSYSPERINDIHIATISYQKEHTSPLLLNIRLFLERIFNIYKHMMLYMLTHDNDYLKLNLRGQNEDQ